MEVLNGQLKPKQVSERIDRKQLVQVTQDLLNLTYTDSAKDLLAAIDTYLIELPGGEDWLEARE